MQSKSSDQYQHEEHPIQLGEALSILRSTPGLDVPSRLVTGEEVLLHRIRKPGQSDQHKIFANIDCLSQVDRFIRPEFDPYSFGDEAIKGHRAFGVESVSGRRSAVIVQSRRKGVSLFLRLLVELRGDHDSRHVTHSYLEDLTSFLGIAQNLGLSTDIVEIPGSGRYRIFDDQGHGVEKNISLAGSPNRRKELNRLIAEIAIRKVDIRSRVTRFTDNEAFQDWQFDHPTGSVVVLGNTRPFIHSAGCPTMIKEQRSELEVACAANMHDLLIWADEYGYRIPGLCSKCFTLPDSR